MKEIILAKHAGLCHGVERALALALEAKKMPVRLLGNIAHNEYVIKMLEDAGRRVIEESDLDHISGGSVVIRAHGVTPTVYDKLRSIGVEIIDATCPFVRKIHEIVTDYDGKGYRVIIVGDPTHPEVIGTRGYAAECEVIDSLEKAKSTVFDQKRDYALVCQSTFSENKANIIINHLKNTIKSLAIYQTICYTTKERQAEAKSISCSCDAVLVIGSHSSSNTAKLVDICGEHCRKVYRIRNASDVKNIDLTDVQKIGVTAGASTPKELIMEVLSGMSNENEVTLRTTENETTEAVAPVTAAAEEVKESKPTSKKMTMDDVMASTSFEIREGMRVKVSVIRNDETGVYVSGLKLGKKDGYIAADRLTDGEYKPEDFPVGMEFTAVVVPNTNGNKDYIALDKKKFDEVEEMDKALLDSVFELKIDKAVDKGGLLGKKGSYTVFIPVSHIELHRVADEDLQSYVGKKLLVKKLPDKKGEEGAEVKRHRIVASHKEVLIAEKKAAREKAEQEWQAKKAREEEEKKAIFEANRDRFEVNNVVPGVVKRFAEFGAFVNVYGFDCLAPKTELSWIKGQAPADVLEIGKEYEFVVIKVDPENYKVSLSYKLLQKRPYEIAQEKYPVGTIVTGTVQTIVNFGAFISIEPGVDGLVHVSNISDKRLNSPADVLKVGDVVQAKVIKFENNRMALSIKDAQEPAEGEAPEGEKRVRSTARPTAERRGKKPATDEISREEQEIVENFGATEKVQNNILGDLLKDFTPSDEKK